MIHIHQNLRKEAKKALTLFTLEKVDKVEKCVSSPNTKLEIESLQVQTETAVTPVERDAVIFIKTRLSR